MSTNGGTMPVPQTQPTSASLSCAPCGLNLESAGSMSVHQMTFHSQDQQQLGPARWGSSPSSTTTPMSEPNETNNNHQPLGKHQQQHHIKATMSPPSQHTIAAAADSSDNNNPPTPQQSEGEHNNFSNGVASNFAQQSNPTSTPSEREIGYPGGYYGEYASYAASGDYGHHILNGQQQQHHQQQQPEYKTVPSSRFLHQQQASAPFNSSTHNSSSSTTNTNSASVQISNNGLSPRVVSSSSPSNHNSNNSSSPQHQQQQLMHIPPGQPTPSPSPKQCDKCGVVCETDGELIEHSQVAHSHVNGSSNGVKSETSAEIHNNFPPFGHHHHHHHYAPHIVKDEPSSDILDLDSQKMVYPPHHADGSLPPMHSLHPLQSMQRHPMMWSHHDAPHFIPPPHPGYHQSFKPADYHPPTPPIKNEYGSGMSMKSSVSDYSPILPSVAGLKQDYNSIKAEYNGPTGLSGGVLPPASSIGAKSGYVSDINENGAHLTSSPSDFPSTTTPQENGGNSGSYQRTFEPPSSSLPQKGAPGWKSNEARRPKTYNCTACNKWFTSSGHLKRHYNTTLHKNAVKSSGHPDPATLPISAHHHPQRDPNYVSKRRSHHRNQQNQSNNSANQQQQQQNSSQASSQNQIQQQTVVSEASTKSPDYTPQFALPSFGASAALQQGFQQYGSTNLHNAPGNGQAGPSVHVASQQRGLHQILMSTSDLISPSDTHHQALHQLEVSPHQLHQQQQQQLQLQDISIHTINSTQPLTIMQLQQPTSSISSMDQDFPLHINTSTPSYPTTIMLQPSYHNITGNLVMQQQQQREEEKYIIQSYQDDQHQHHHHSPNSEIEDYADEQQHMVAALPSMQPSLGSHMISYDQMSRYNSGGMFTQDLYHPNSPELPEEHYTTATMLSTGSYSDDLMPQSASMSAPPAPSSPSVSSSVPNLKVGGASKTAAASAKLSKAVSAPTQEYRCEQCNKEFNKSCYLTQHNKTFHMGDKPFKCQRCGKRFPCEATHEEHLAKHGGDKPYKCQECVKAFNHKTDLRRHMCLHSGTKPFTCQECGKGFIRKDHMVKHMDTHKKKLNGVKKAKSGKKKFNPMNAIQQE